MRTNTKEYFNGKTVVITGGASGIGLEMAKYAAEAGGTTSLIPES